MDKKRTEATLRELKTAGSAGLDLSPGDPLCLQAATVIEWLRGEAALARDTAFWSDCHYDKGIKEQGPRGANHCLHEGTHVCRACDIADLQRRVRELWVEGIRNRIRFHAHLYYNLGQNLIPDGEYDSMFRHLQMIEREHPELVTPDSPTQLIGESISRPLREIR